MDTFEGYNEFLEQERRRYQQPDNSRVMELVQEALSAAREAVRIANDTRELMKENVRLMRENLELTKLFKER